MRPPPLPGRHGGGSEAWGDAGLNGTIEQAGDAIERCSQLGALRSGMRTRVTAGSARLHPSTGELLTRALVTVPHLRDHLEVSDPTARIDVDRLVGAGVPEELPASGRPEILMVPEITAIACRETPEARPAASPPRD